MPASRCRCRPESRRRGAGDRADEALPDQRMPKKLLDFVLLRKGMGGNMCVERGGGAMLGWHAGNNSDRNLGSFPKG